MEKNKEKLHDDRTAIKKKQQIDRMERDCDAPKKETMLMVKMNDKNVKIKRDTEAKINVMLTRVFSQIGNTRH